MSNKKKRKTADEVAQSKETNTSALAILQGRQTQSHFSGHQNQHCPSRCQLFPAAGVVATQRGVSREQVCTKTCAACRKPLLPKLSSSVNALVNNALEDHAGKVIQTVESSAFNCRADTTKGLLG